MGVDGLLEWVDVDGLGEFGWSWWSSDEAFGMSRERGVEGGGAAALGVSESELMGALGNPPDVEAAAEALGIELDELTAALPTP